MVSPRSVAAQGLPNLVENYTCFSVRELDLRLGLRMDFSVVSHFWVTFCSNSKTLTFHSKVYL